jgi:TPR repeat protein
MIVGLVTSVARVPVVSTIYAVLIALLAPPSACAQHSALGPLHELEQIEKAYKGDAANSVWSAIGAALIELGDLFRDGGISPADAERTIRYYGKLAERNGGAALFAVVFPRQICSCSGGGAPDLEAAAAAYSAAFSFGEPEGMVRLGDIRFQRAATAGDFEEALGYYRRAAAAGSAAGKIRAGEMLARGQGVDQDVNQGRALVRQVAEAGDASAFVSLGDLYSTGDAGPIDAALAIGAYEKAASSGSPEALLRLGDLYRDGKIVPPNGDRAAHYYLLAAQPAPAAVEAEP